MALHVIVFRRRYPFYKYMVVLFVTIGVSLFTMYHPSAAAKASKSNTSFSTYGLFLLAINLLFDGLTNSTQDHIFRTQSTITGPKLMCGVNLVSTLFTSIFLYSPFTNQLPDALDFFRSHPKIMADVCLFALCGALGQVFIFYTLERFGSLVLVTVTVTRKMMSMLLSVVWFNHKLSIGQWVGVLMVFGSVVFEATVVKFLDKNRKSKKL